MNRVFWSEFFLISARLLSGGALLVASIGKLQDPAKLMLSMKSFELVPEFVIPFSAYLLPWLELFVGICLIYGVLARGAAFWASILYVIFTVALASVLIRGMNVDCGCFGAIAGSGPVGIHSIIRNLILLSASLVVLYFGSGRSGLDHFLALGRGNSQQSASSSGSPTAASTSSAASI
ncbi:MAG: MauE/DoxX family redox-associated membrane protein [Candidatus Sumerlaeia bacterium]|nr:MauE/DoxX family redox-associated membrane protein [Candidatus Sumerlaeia bacterium]